MSSIPLLNLGARGVAVAGSTATNTQRLCQTTVNAVRQTHALSVLRTLRLVQTVQQVKNNASISHRGSLFGITEGVLHRLASNHTLANSRQRGVTRRLNMKSEIRYYSSEATRTPSGNALQNTVSLSKIARNVGVTGLAVYGTWIAYHDHEKIWKANPGELIGLKKTFLLRDRSLDVQADEFAAAQQTINIIGESGRRMVDKEYTFGAEAISNPVRHTIDALLKRGVKVKILISAKSAQVDKYKEWTQNEPNLSVYTYSDNVYLPFHGELIDEESAQIVPKCLDGIDATDPKYIEYYKMDKKSTARTKLHNIRRDFVRVFELDGINKL